MNSSTSWPIVFVLSNIVQLALVVPHMLSCTSMNALITVAYVLGTVGDAIWHVGREGEAMVINIASLFYLMGTITFVYNFFVGPAARGTKVAMGILYLANIYTFGDPNDTEGRHFLEKHILNHLGSTLFYYVAANAEYQTKKKSTTKCN